MHSPEISFVIPCFNEAPSLNGLVSDFAPLAAAHSLELVLVNNGSTDETAAALEALARSHPFLKIVQIPRNEGYGHGIHQGLKAARGNWLGWAHADRQHSPEQALRKFKEIREEKVFLKGLRRNRPPLDAFFTWGMALFESALFGTFLWDISAQPTLMPRSLFLEAGEPPGDFAFDLFYYKRAKDLGYRVVRFDAPVKPRLIGRSSWNTGIFSRFRLAWRIVCFSFRLRREKISP